MLGTTLQGWFAQVNNLTQKGLQGMNHQVSNFWNYEDIFGLIHLSTCHTAKLLLGVLISKYFFFYQPSMLRSKRQLFSLMMRSRLKYSFLRHFHLINYSWRYEKVNNKYIVDNIWVQNYIKCNIAISFFNNHTTFTFINV